MTKEKDYLKKLLQPVALPGGRLLPSRILPGPMEGIMTDDYCRTMMEFDLLPVWVTPFIRISHSTPRTKKLEGRLTPFRPIPIVAQIMGTYREHLAATAGILSGLNGVLGVELNCACSSPTVVRSGSGSAHLRKPEWIRDTLLAMREAADVGGIGVKIRSGFESPEELPRILEAVGAAKPDWIVLHYRTAKEMFWSVPDGYGRFEIARRLLPGTLLFASGDMFTCEKSLGVVRKTAVDGITPARGLMHNPWLIRDIEAVCRGETPPERNVVPFLLRLVQLVAESPVWRNGLILEIARNVWGRESECFKSLARTSGPSAMLKIIGGMK
ncbi:MAG: tRNA-dihydrouridine synthase family protein [Lentisphaerae bacterium]|nr:tRNA-dihydrouridine synthase family protein [Lentisphaerota bacterium]